ncbi:MAG: Zn-dependent hydrolase [Desulfobacterales bacterium]|nr:MAG: Zn-dependent hydrolase [Desulfobacterales bacterium]
MDTRAGREKITHFDVRAEAERLFADLEQTSTDSVGITREAYGEGEQEALKLFESFGRRFGLETGVDDAANLVVTLPGKDSSRPAIVCGSHMDSVPHGGNYDGAAGIVAGLLGLARMRHENVVPEQDIKVFCFRCEESAWFGKPYIGSSALFGALSEEDLASRHRSGHERLIEAMARVGADVERISRGEPLIDPSSIAVYLELHIEQGPVMISRQLPVAVVTGIRGAIRHRRITCRGKAGHSGTVPRWLRQDAFFATAELISTLDEHWRVLLERGLDLVITSGIVETNSREHAMTRIPREVSFSFEVRSQSTDALEAFYHLMQTECAAIERSRRVRFELDRKLYTAPAKISKAWIDRLMATAEKFGIKADTIPSGAGHDAAVFANAGIPSAMIFVRNDNGSHNPDESMEIEDFIEGAALLYHTLKEPL